MYNENGYNIKDDIYSSAYNNVPIYKFSLSGELLGRFNSIKEASEFELINSRGSINACCLGFCKYTNGVTYRYCKDFKDDEIIKIQPIQTQKVLVEKIYDLEKMYDYDFTQSENFIILCYSLKGILLNIFNTVSDVANKLNLNKQTVFNRLKENNRILSSDSPKFRVCVNYIFIRVHKDYNTPQYIKTNLKFLQKINIKNNSVEYEYGYECRKDCAKELNIKPYSLDGYIKRKKPINGYLYQYKSY
jgi:hypothetical protein